MSNLVALQVVQDFFCAASSRAYAGGGIYVPSLIAHGKQFDLRENFSGLKISLHLHDEFISNGPFSGGTTYIHATDIESGHQGIDWRCWRPIWMMQYRGRENEGWGEEVRSFLRAALMAAYSHHEFCGGRGKYPFHTIIGEGDRFYYENEWTGNFTQFTGTEEIFRASMGDHTVFHYDFGGQLLVETRKENGKNVIEI